MCGDRLTALYLSSLILIVYITVYTANLCCIYIDIELVIPWIHINLLHKISKINQLVESLL